MEILLSRLLRCYALKPFDHAEHDAHGEQADGEEDAPCVGDGPLVVHERANPQQQVAHGGGAEPQAQAPARQVLGSDLRDEAQAQRRDEELGHGEEEV